MYLVSNLGSIVQPLIDALPETLQGFVSAINTLWATNVWSALQNLFKTEFEIELPDWETFKTNFIEGWNSKVWQPIQDLLKTTFGIEVPDWEATKTLIANAWQTVKDTFSGIVGIVFGIDTPDAVSLKTKIRNWWESAKATFHNLVGILFGIENPDTEALKEQITGWWETAKSFFTGVIGIVYNILPPGVQTIIQQITNWWEKNIVGSLGLSVSYAVNDPKVTVSDAQNAGMTNAQIQMGVASGDIVPNAKGAVFSAPTLFDTRLGRQLVGEAGPEAVAPISVLQGYVRDAVDTANLKQDAVLSDLTDAIREMRDGNGQMDFYLNKKQVATALARDMGRSIGNRSYELLRGMGG